MGNNNLNSFIQVDLEYLDQKIKENLSVFGYYEYEDKKTTNMFMNLRIKTKKKIF